MAVHEQADETETPRYTRTGDEGFTTLGDRSRVEKTDPRIAAYAACEEANTAIGVALAGGAFPKNVATVLARLQNDLIEVEGDLGTPTKRRGDRQTRIDDDYIRRVEEACRHFSSELPELSSFVVPGGTLGGAMLYRAYTDVRRAERATWAAVEQCGDVNTLVGRYLNRLGELMFVLARAANSEHGDTMWEPGLTARVGLLPTEDDATAQT
ncbi:cob(I)alamin adenosyltransferase [Amycolatopsis marina]|uniref:Corrinoid adenosyltransferase n=1 Tax=Amycolatopsis marina TaxID=490629 RepID=A0A1I0XA14_9PSEU|nr:cob(I)yrinic acid a,c-diamide adenosyltransferase [Amycolatopsis marina]SFA97791.1 cob(I)alamin adenosyltransferase [Amycolatopsis marina]